MYPNTLLGYFKTGLEKAGYSVKYFTRKFLAVYLVDYNRGDRDYTETAKTDFYRLNGTAYCYFLELYHEYRLMMDRLNAMGY